MRLVRIIPSTGPTNWFHRFEFSKTEATGEHTLEVATRYTDAKHPEQWERRLQVNGSLQDLAALHAALGRYLEMST